MSHTPSETPMAGTGTPESTEKPYSEKIGRLAGNPKHRGAFFTEDATAKDLALLTAKYKDIKIYWLVDPESDLIYDAKFFSYGGPISMAMGEMLCSLVRGMKIDTACDIPLEEVESLLRDDPTRPASVAPMEEAFANLPMLLATAKESYPSAKALALASLQMKKARQPGAKPSWESLTAKDEEWLKRSKEDQIQEIDALIARDIRPGLNFDGGDLEIEDLEEGYKLSIRYQGACGGCGSSTGATLSFIEDTLRREVFGGIQVVPV